MPMRLRGGDESSLQDEDSGSIRAEGPSWNDDLSEDDDNLVDLSEINEDDEKTRNQVEPIAEEDVEQGDGGSLEDLLNKFLERQEDDSDSDDITHEWIRNLPEDAKDDPAFIAEFEKLESTLIARRNLPKPSLAERVQAKFVAAAQEGKEDLVKYEPTAP